MAPIVFADWRGCRDINLFGNGEERRDHVYIDDVAELMVRVLAHRSVGALNIRQRRYAFVYGDCECHRRDRGQSRADRRQRRG